MDTEELNAFLAQSSNTLRVTPIQTYKSSSFEETQLVAISHDDETVLAIRKVIKADPSLGGAYEDIYEAQLAGRVFKYIPHIYGCERMPNGDLVVDMEYLQGKTLDAYVQLLNLEQRARLFLQVCQAVEELHSIGEHPLLHRDLKPSNVMVVQRQVPYQVQETNNGDAALKAEMYRSGQFDGIDVGPALGQVYLIDFGIARSYSPDKKGDTHVAGTRAYASPEQFGFGQTDVRSDVYSLGVVLFYLLMDREPTSLERSEGFRSVKFFPAQSHAKALMAVIQKACSLDPKDRYISVESLEKAVSKAAHIKEKNLAYRKSGVIVSTQECKPIPQSKLRKTIGKIWNALLVVFTLFCYGCLVSIVVAPSGKSELWPVWFRVFGFLGIAGTWVLSVCCALFDFSRTKISLPMGLRGILVRVGVLLGGVATSVLLVIQYALPVMGIFQIS